MPLNDVSFNIQQGGLGRIVTNEDNISAIWTTITLPTAYVEADILGRSYSSITDVEADGIIESDPLYAELHYFVSEFFRISPGATLWLVFDTELDTDRFATITGGKVKQIAISKGLGSEAMPDYQERAKRLKELHCPAVILAHLKDSSDLQVDLTALEYPDIAYLDCYGANGKALELRTALSKDISAIGAVLGAMSKASVHESVAWVKKFNLSDGVELEKFMLRGGDPNTPPTLSQLEAQDALGHLVLRKHVGIGGTYLQGSLTGTSHTSDYCTIENNRTINKAVRGIRSILLPELNGPLRVDAEGKLDPGTIRYYETLTSRPLDFMSSAGEISAYGVYINPDQDVLSTSILNIQVRVVPVGVAREIIVNIGLSTNTNF